VFLVTALIVATPLLLLFDRQPHRWRAAAALAAALCVSAIVLAPVAAEYAEVHRDEGLERTLDEVAAKSAEPGTYLASPARLHQRLWAYAERRPHDYLFPGAVMLFLAATAIVGLAMPAARRRRDPRVVAVTLAYATVAAVGVLASFGPQGIAGISLYRLAYAAGPLFHGLRQVSRFAVLAIFGASVLAALGASVLESLRPRAGTLAVTALACVAFVELLVAPLSADRPGGEALVRVPPVPPVYEWLAQQPGTFAIVELPFAPRGQMWENGSYVYWSTVHWHGLVDGYSGFAPPSYAPLVRILNGFPDPASHEALLERHVRYVIVHRSLYKPWNPPLNFARIERTPWLHEVQQFPDVDVLAVLPDERFLTRADDRR